MPMFKRGVSFWSRPRSVCSSSSSFVSTSVGHLHRLASIRPVCLLVLNVGLLCSQDCTTVSNLTSQWRCRLTLSDLRSALELIRVLI